MSTRVYTPDEPHRCDLPGLDGFIGGSTDDRGALEVCECGRAWVYDPIPWEQTYRPLRPWPFDRAQRQALRDHRLLGSL